MPSKLNLITHCGATRADRQQVFDTRTPAPTRTHYPLAHRSLITQVELSLENCNLEVVNEAHALDKDGNRYFGLFQVARKNDNRVQIAEVGDGSIQRATGDDYSWVLGLRNSHDKTFPAGMLLGSQVFVCDNLAFNSTEIKISRKHTRYCADDLTKLISQGVGCLVDKWHDLDDRIKAYQTTGLEDRDMHDLVIRSIDNGAITNQQAPRVLKEYRTPRHATFAQHKNVWRFFNAVTEVAKENSVFTLPGRTAALHGVLDGYCGLALAN